MTSLKAVYPDLSSFWNPKLNQGRTSKDVQASSTLLYVWKCPKGPDHEVCDPTTKVNRCHNFEPQYLCVTTIHYGCNSHRPDACTVHYNCIVVCALQWAATISDRRARGAGWCPSCAGLKASVTNSLATRCPEVAAQWCAERNKGKLVGPEAILVRLVSGVGFSFARAPPSGLQSSADGAAVLADCH